MGDWLRPCLSVALFQPEASLTIFCLLIHYQGPSQLYTRAVGSQCPQTCSKFGEGPCFCVVAFLQACELYILVKLIEPVSTILDW